MPTTLRSALWKWLIAVGLVCVALVISLLMSRLVRESPAPRIAAGFHGEWPRYGSLGELAAAADLVIQGTVAEVGFGETDAAGTPEEVRHLNTVVVVDDVLRGSAAAGSITVKTLAVAYSDPDAEEWRQPGEQVVLFLSRSRETSGLYIPANTNYDQTAYVVRGDQVDPVLVNSLSERIGALSVQDLLAQVATAD